MSIARLFASLLCTLVSLLVQIDQNECVCPINVPAPRLRYSYVREYIHPNSVCSTFILPGGRFRIGYFLEIYWYHIQASGRMPDCNGDYVEVFLTRQYRSVGRFCADAKPFRMFSYDGVAKMTFNMSHTANGANVYFRYRLRRIEYGFLGVSMSPKCQNTEKFDTSGIIFSYGWPRGYQTKNFPCLHKIHVGQHKITKLTIMDLDLNGNEGTNACSSNDDYIEIRVSDRITDDFSSSSNITGKLCQMAVKSITTRKQHIYIRFQRKLGSLLSGRRGFVMGYEAYDLPSPPTTSLTSVNYPSRSSPTSTMHSAQLTVTSFVKATASYSSINAFTASPTTKLRWSPTLIKSKASFHSGTLTAPSATSTYMRDSDASSSKINIPATPGENTGDKGPQASKETTYTVIIAILVGIIVLIVVILLLVRNARGKVAEKKQGPPQSDISTCYFSNTNEVFCSRSPDSSEMVERENEDPFVMENPIYSPSEGARFESNTLPYPEANSQDVTQNHYDRLTRNEVTKAENSVDRAQSISSNFDSNITNKNELYAKLNFSNTSKCENDEMVIANPIYDFSHDSQG